MQNVFLFLSVGLVAINLILMEFMQNTIEKEERIKIAVLTEQNQKNRIANYQDREEIYERQRRKMHDYKNQLSTIQTLIKNGHTDEALSFTQWSSCKEMVFVCVIWSFDDMGLGEQVILSDKGNRETEQIINIGKVIIFWNRDGRMFYVKDYRLCFFISKNIRDIRRKCNRQFSVVSVEQQFCSVPVSTMEIQQNVPRYITICTAKCRKRTDWLPGTPLKNMREFTDRHFMMPQKRLILTGKLVSQLKMVH